MEKVYVVSVSNQFRYDYSASRHQGFDVYISECNTFSLPSGKNVIEYGSGDVRVVSHHENIYHSRSDALQAAVDELHVRIGVIREKIDELRTEILNRKGEAQNG